MNNSQLLFDVFQPGLRRGSAATVPGQPHKQYFYVEHPTEGWRVYLRSAVFLHPELEPFNPYKFLVVKRTGARKSSATWEPPKGQMEWKDTPAGRGNILQLLKENVLRETMEESHITRIKNLKHMGLVFQSQESSYPANHYFQYHIFQGFVSLQQIQQSFDTFEWIKEHPKGFLRWKKDRREKDAVDWFDPYKTRLNPRWCPDIAALYFRAAT